MAGSGRKAVRHNEKWRDGRSRRERSRTDARAVQTSTAHEVLDDVDGQREDDGGVLLGADARQRLQVAQLQRGRTLGDYFGGLLQGARRALLALRRDHLRARLAHRLRLRRHLRAALLAAQVSAYFSSYSSPASVPRAAAAPAVARLCCTHEEIGSVLRVASDEANENRECRVSM